MPNPLVSVSMKNSSAKFGSPRTGAEVMAFLSAVKATSELGVQIKFPVLSMSLSGFAMSHNASQTDDNTL